MKDESSVFFVRLKNGDDLITEAVEHFKSKDSHDEGYHYYMFTNPLKILYMTNPKTGGMAMGFLNWVSPVFVPDQTFNVNLDDILLISNTTVEMSNNYYGSLEEISSYGKNDVTVEEMLSSLDEEDEPPPDKKYYN